MPYDSTSKLEIFFAKLRSLGSFESIPIITVHTVDSTGDTPLHIAAIWGDVEAIDVLLEAGADIDAKGDMGCTPLHYAIGQKKVEAAKRLISHGASLDVKDEMSDGWTPVDKARFSDNEEIRKLFERK